MRRSPGPPQPRYCTFGGKILISCEPSPVRSGQTGGCVLSIQSIRIESAGSCCTPRIAGRLGEPGGGTAECRTGRGWRGLDVGGRWHQAQAGEGGCLDPGGQSRAVWPTTPYRRMSVWRLRPGCALEVPMFLDVWINRGRTALHKYLPADADGCYRFRTYPEVVTSFRFRSEQGSKHCNASRPLHSALLHGRRDGRVAPVSQGRGPNA